MKDNPSVKAKLFYGVLVVGPMAVIIVIFAQIVELLEKLAKALGLESALSASFLIVIAIAGILLLCYCIGALVHTEIGAWSFDRFEKLILTNIPGYQIVKNIFSGISGDTVKEYKPVMVQLGPSGTGVLGFLMERNANKTLTVFVPISPVLTMGNVHIVEEDRVTPLESGHLDVINCISEWGVGSNQVVGDAKINMNSGT